MKKFLLLYHSPKEAMEKYETMSEADVAQVMGAWMKWKESHGDAIVDFGNPTGEGHKMSPTSFERQVDDVSGYGIIQAESMEDAKGILSDHPMILDNDGSTINVYDIHEM